MWLGCHSLTVAVAVAMVTTVGRIGWELEKFKRWTNVKNLFSG